MVESGNPKKSDFSANLPDQRLASCEAIENCEDSQTIGRLATLLANGVRVCPGEAFPNGWDESAEGRRRRYSQARARQLRAARRLLALDEDNPETELAASE